MRILGIDPGLNGGLVMLDNSRVTGRLVMPTLDAPNGKGREYDLQFILQAWKSWQPDHAVIEQAQAMPGQGVTSCYSIGKGFGYLVGMLAALNVPYQTVRPRIWQKLIFTGLRHEDTKAASALFCQRRWPTVDWRATERCKKVHDGLTDAACLSEYGFRIRG